jgi:hypothetical protein
LQKQQKVMEEGRMPEDIEDIEDKPFSIKVAEATQLAITAYMVRGI